MQCINCRYDNKEGANYCVKCGKPLVQRTNDLLNVAYLLTANQQVANAIASQTSNQDEQVDLSIAWLRQRKADLFQKERSFIDGQPQLEHIVNIQEDFINLDYEERIIVYLYCIKDETIDEIASQLHITSEYVQATLQSAYLKKYPQAPEEENIQIESTLVEDQEPHLKFPIRVLDENKHITKQFKIMVSVFVIVCIAITAILRIHGRNSYQEGMALNESEQYEDAIEPLLEAKRFSNRKRASQALAKAYMEIGDIENALQEYLYLYNHDEKDVIDQIIYCYNELADQSLQNNDLETALTYLQEANTLQEDDYIHIRIAAIENGGEYSDTVTGTTYDMYGNPITLYIRGMDNILVSQAIIQYDENTNVDTIEVTYDDAYTVNVQSNNFDMHLSENVYYLQDVSTSSISISSLRNDITYTNTYDESNRIETCTYTNGSQTQIDTYTYVDESDRIDTIISSQNNLTYDFVYTYEEDILVQIDVKRASRTIGTITYTYDDLGNISEIKEEYPTSLMRDFIPNQGNRRITYRYSSSNQPLTSTIYDLDGNVLANGTYVRHQGWIYLYY